MIESTAVEFFVSKRNVPDQVLLYEQMTNLCQILWKVFVWAAPEISGNGTQHKFRAGSTKSQSPSSPSQPGDVVRSTCKLAFGVLGQLVEVLPKYDIFWSDEVVEVLLRYATIDPEDGEFSPMALNVIVDLLEKGHLPVSASRYLPSLFAKTQDVLVYNLTNEVDEEFKNKTISLTGVFLSIHLHRAVKSSPELLQSTLDMFAKFTLKQEDEESFSFCIETWEIMIENGTCKEGDQAVQQIFRNISELMYEGKVIGQGSIKALDLIEKICTAYPQDIGLAFFEKFMEITSKIFQDSAVFANTSQELIAVTRVLGRIISLLENPFMDHFALAKSILLHHARILTFVDSMHKEQANILTDYSHLTNALFSNLTTFVPWLINYQNAIIENDSEESKYSELVLNLVIFTLQWQEKNSADRWTSSSRFLSNCVNELRPDILHHALTAKILNDLVANRKLSYSVCVNMWDFAATLFLVVPFGKRLSRSDLHTKSIEFQSFVAPILQEVDQFYGIDMQTHPNPLQIRMELIFVFMVIKSITNAAKSGNNSTRELAFGSLIDVVPGLVGMVPFFSQDEEGLAHLFEALGLIIATFKYQLLKAGKFDIISNTFDIMENYLLVSPKPAEEIVTHIFDVFTLISTENSKQFDNLVKKLINFILQLNQKLLLTAAPVDLSINMYLLIESVIKNHWTYFFGSKIQGTATPERQQEFLRLFEILATTLTRNETDIARQVISICRDLNQQFHLFEKVYCILT